MNTTEKKLAIYSRTSTDKQEKGLEAQQRALHEYLEYKKIPPGNVLEFSDEGISGMKRSRPGFDRLMAAVRAGEVHTVLVYSFSRFARSTKHLIDSLEEFQAMEIDFVSLSENIDTKGPVGRLIFKIFASLAEFERDQTAERVKNGLKNARAKGKKLGQPKKFERDAIREMHRRGMSFDDIRSATVLPMETVKKVLELHAAGVDVPGIKAELKLPASFVNQVLTGLDAGLPPEEIQARTGVSRGSYLRAIKEAP